MHVRFAEMDANFIKEEVAKGAYSNETELVRNAVRKMREEQEKLKLEYFKNAIAQGMEDIEQGRTVDYTRELLQRIKQKAIIKAQNKEPYNSNNSVPDDV